MGGSAGWFGAYRIPTHLPIQQRTSALEGTRRLPASDELSRPGEMCLEQRGDFAILAFASFALPVIVTYFWGVLCFGEKERTS
jgi:hypothetical protein